jgi:type I restriction enzyme S subunit
MKTPTPPERHSTQSPSWPRVHLGDLSNLVNGDAYRDSDWAATGIPIIRIQNLNNPAKLFNHWAGSLHDRVVVNNGDVLLAWSGTPGTSFGAHRWNRGRAVLNQHIFRVDLDKSRLDPDWGVYAINEQLEEMIGRAHGAVGLRHVTKKEVQSLAILLPPLPEQRRIAARLREQLAAVAEARAAVRAQLDAAAAFPKAVLTEAFHGVTPLSLASSPQAPSGWSWFPLAKLARLESGHTPSRYRPEWWGGTVPWIALPDIRALDGKVAHETLEYTNADGIANSSARILPAGTVVLSRTASVGFVTIMGRPMATSQDFVNWVCGPGLEPKYLLYLLQCSRGYIRDLSSGAINKTVYMPTVKQFQVCVPPVQQQYRIAVAIETRFQASVQANQLIQDRLTALDHLPAALLREAFAGRI